VKTFDPHRITRPDPALMRYYLITAILTGPGFPFVILPLYFKFHTLRYTFDDRGVSMSWGILFKREIHLTYRRIQDIHLTRNFIQRWMGLATVAIQTASGSSGPEMSIEGILAAEELRDYLYSMMRGGTTEVEGPESADVRSGDSALELLTEIRDLLRELRQQRGAQP
jgi:uncharacterized membrane protein YdbT with pleckstrin-like domain